MARLEGKVAVVTGGANGIGRATVLRFLDEGARVVIADLNEANGHETVNLAAEAGHGDAVRFMPCDVASEEDIEAAVQCAVSDFGRLDCIFNNAGIGGAFGSIVETSAEDWDFSTGVLLRSVFLGMKHAGRVMLEQGEGGSIISTASVAGLGGGAGPHCYSACKAGVVNLTRTVAAELAAFRIRVNAVAPGTIMTDLFHGGDPEGKRAQVLDKQPWPEIGVPDDIAGAVLYLASEDARFVTGETLVVDGGQLAKGPELFSQKPDSTIFTVIGLNKGSTGEGMEIYKRIKRDT
ncbi:MAG: glucose 1-dehydrogenase [Alphaproteobacteria bacterium]|nr:glucose 1-dehydrogenase [Alphaproteobacteria bacterium]